MPPLGEHLTIDPGAIGRRGRDRRAMSCGVPKRSKRIHFRERSMSSCDFPSRTVRSRLAWPIALKVIGAPANSLERIAVSISTATWSRRSAICLQLGADDAGGEMMMRPPDEAVLLLRRPFERALRFTVIILSNIASSSCNTRECHGFRRCDQNVYAADSFSVASNMRATSLVCGHRLRGYRAPSNCFDFLGELRNFSLYCLLVHN